MQVEIKIDASCVQPRVVVMAAAMTDEVNAILEKLAQDEPRVLCGIRQGRVEPLEPEELIRVYAGAGRVFAVTSRGEYLLRLRLYEVLRRLDATRFVRISNSEIINLKKAESFDLSLAGTICVRMRDGACCYVSRRHVARIKKILGV